MVGKLPTTLYGNSRKLALPAAPARLPDLPAGPAKIFPRNCCHFAEPLIIFEAMASKKPSRKIATAIEIERAIHVFRGQRVMLDSDLAVLYGVATRRLNEQVNRNRDRFPDDFAFQLTQQEFTALMSQIATSKPGRGGRRKRPFAFTEQGVAMLSSVLKSPTAVQVNIEIMRAFVRLRRLLATPGELVEQLTKLADSVQLHDDQIKVISQVLQQMLEKPAVPRRSIGFHADKND